MKRKYKIQKLIIVPILIFVLIFSPIKTAKADIWLINMAASTWEQIWKQILDTIENTIFTALKNAAELTLQQSVENAITAGNLHTMAFVSDWADYLFDSPLSAADLYLNDFFTFSTRGRAGMANYQSCKGPGSSGSNITPYLMFKTGAQFDLNTIEDALKQQGSNYYQYLTTLAVLMGEKISTNINMGTIINF